ncbi:peptide chain release factor N(5)-glutamine methyltransferase [Desulfovibrio sp. OttesenSCG-928-C14]|nr:peptide chain release factor N(5)-glutamine methyltransferase [Desulfovibrio sp. OttesenSCG-928-C14]
MSRLKNILAATKLRFNESGVESPDLSAELLVAEALGLERSAMIRQLILSPNLAFPRKAFEKLQGMVIRRLRREPVALILGRKEFYGRSFKVSRDTLIPRPETELIVDFAKTFDCIEKNCLFADLGAGSGCLAVTLALEHPSWRGLALDFSRPALEMARHNAEDLGAAGSLEFIQADFKALPFAAQSLDLIVSNPPYVSEAEYLGLEPELRLYEPKSALVPGPEGTEDLRAICLQAAICLRSGGILLMELGAAQGQAMASFAQASPDWMEPAVLQDLAGLDRVLFCRKK